VGIVKKVRCTCRRCGKAKYHEAAKVDQTEPFLCPKCDDLFMVWQNEALESCNEGKRTLEHFLAQRPQR